MIRALYIPVKKQLIPDRILIPRLIILLFPYIDLGWTVTDLVQNKGSKAAAILREKANQLEEALNETKSKYTVEMMPD